METVKKSEYKNENFKHEIKTEKCLVHHQHYSSIKCGELFYNEHRILQFFCLLCSDTINEVTQFSDHILNHISEITNNIKQELEYEEINNTFMSEFENEVIHQPQQQQQQQQLSDELNENDDELSKSLCESSGNHQKVLIDASTSTEDSYSIVTDFISIDPTNSDGIFSMLSDITKKVSKIDASQKLFDKRMHKLETAMEFICETLSGKKFANSMIKIELNEELINDTPFTPIATISELNNFEEKLTNPGFHRKMFKQFELVYNDVKLSEKYFAYMIVDKMFKFQLFNQIRWQNGNKSDEQKISFESYKRVVDFFISIVHICHPNCPDSKIYGFFKDKTNSRISKCAKNSGKRILCQKNISEIKINNDNNKLNGISVGNKFSVSDNNDETKNQIIFKSEIVKSSECEMPHAKRRRLSEINFHSIDDSFGIINNENIPDNEIVNNGTILIDRWKSA